MATVTEEQLQRLYDDLVSGTLDVTFKGRRETKRSVAEIKEALRFIEAGPDGLTIRRVHIFQDDE